jgi:hypothetical protein
LYLCHYSKLYFPSLYSFIIEWKLNTHYSNMFIDLHFWRCSKKYKRLFLFCGIGEDNLGFIKKVLSCWFLLNITLR